MNTCYQRKQETIEFDLQTDYSIKKFGPDSRNQEKPSHIIDLVVQSDRWKRKKVKADKISGPYPTTEKSMKHECCGCVYNSWATWSSVNNTRIEIT